MPQELIPVASIILFTAITASMIELRASLRPPVCPQCVHCRHESVARQARDDHERAGRARSLWGVDDRDDDRRNHR